MRLLQYKFMLSTRKQQRKILATFYLLRKGLLLNSIYHLILNGQRNLFDGDTLITDGFKSYFCFEHVIITTHFHSKISKTQLKKNILKGFKNFRVVSR